MFFISLVKLGGQLNRNRKIYVFSSFVLVIARSIFNIFRIHCCISYFMSSLYRWTFGILFFRPDIIIIHNKYSGDPDIFNSIQVE